jgi:hypothetical protein
MITEYAGSRPEAQLAAADRGIARDWAASPVRHGASIVRSGCRHALGLVFHDA